MMTVMYKLDPDKVVEGPAPLAEKLKSMDFMQDSDVYEIIKNGLPILLSVEVDNPCFDELKKSPRFISILTVVCAEQDLTYDQRIYCNSMLYKILADSTEDLYMQKVCYMLGAVVNRSMVDKIEACGLERIYSTYLAIARKSSFDAKDNITRMNFVIMCGDPTIMTVQRITDIYCSVFNSLEEIKNLFLLTIRDTYVLNSDEDWITDDIIAVSHRIDNSVISILDSLSYNNLYTILSEFAKMCLIEDLDSADVRFSFHEIDISKFKNIGAVLAQLNRDEIDIL